MDPNQYPRPPQQPMAPQPPPFAYDTRNGGHFGASSQVAQSGYIPATAQFNSTFQNVTQGLQGQYRNILATYWQHVIYEIENEDHDFKIHQLPLARIKKVMKSDEDVKMISAEAPILFAKGCDIFITELTMRAWIHAEESKRRTLQRSDIAQAISKSDMFDFLIDIVPREVAQHHAAALGVTTAGGAFREDGSAASPTTAGAPGAAAGGQFPLAGYGDHGSGAAAAAAAAAAAGVNYQSGPLTGYTATPPGSSAGPSGQAYPHHPGHPLYDGNRYDPMYYSGQQGLHNLSYPAQHSDQGDQQQGQGHEYNGPAGQSAYPAGDDVTHYYASGDSR